MADPKDARVPAIVQEAEEREGNRKPSRGESQSRGQLTDRVLSEIAIRAEASTRWQRGVLERKRGQTTDVIKDLKRALELKRARHEAHAALAEAYEEKNDLGAASA